MNLLNKLTIKNLKLNKKRTIVTIVGIMLSVALLTSVASIYASGIKSLISFEVHEKGNFHFAFYNVPLSEIKTFENNRAIEEINLTQDIGYAKISSKNEYKPYAFIKSFTKSSLNNLSVKLIEGRLPIKSNEIVIPTHLKTNGRLDLKVGDTITLEVGKRVDQENNELNQNNPYYPENNHDETNDTLNNSYIETNHENIINTISKTYKIVGIIERPASNIENYSAPGYTFITYMDQNNISGNVDVFVRYNKKGIKNVYQNTANLLGIDGDALEKFYSNKPLSSEEYNNVNNEIKKAKYNININDYLIGLETNPITSTGVGGLGVVVSIVMGIIVFTSVFCIRNSFDISITEKIKQYGMLRSIGATKKQIKKNVFYEASILGIIGIPLGLLSGFLATFILIIISNYYLKDMLSTGLKLEFSFSFIAVVIAVILGIITIYLSAFRSARKAAAISPIDSIRNSANIKINSKKVKSPKLIKKIFGIGGEISYKNLKRNKKKYRTTVISIIVSVFVFIGLSSFMNIAFDTVENELNISEYNISLYASNYKDETYQKIIETTQLDNIGDFTILKEATLSFSNTHYNKEYLSWRNLELDSNIPSYITITAIGDYQYQKYLKSLGLDYNNVKNNAILFDYLNVSKYDEEKDKFISKSMRVYDFKTNDIINGNINGKNDNFSIEIVALTDEAPFGLKNDSIARIIISDELFDQIVDNNNLTIYFKSNNATKLQDDIDAYLDNEEYTLNNLEENTRIMNNLFTLIGIFLYGFIVVITLIGITNIFNTITTNMQLRRQEFAMLKSVGMTTKEFNRMIRLESLFMGFKSLIIGIPIGILISYVIYYFLAKDEGIPYKLPIVAILLSIITVFILISIIMKYSLNKINKQNTIETIRNENI